MTKDEERAVLERAAKVCLDESRGMAGAYYADKILALPLESKEVEAEPVAWMTERGNLLHGSIIEFHRQNNIDAAERFNIPLYLHPAECPKCAESEQASLGSLHYAGDLLKRAEAAEAKCAEMQDALVQAEAWKGLAEALEAKWTAEKHVRQQTQERLAKAKDFIFDYCKPIGDHLVWWEKYKAITGGMK